MRHEADAATERIQPAGALPDPVLRVELENVNNYGTSNAPACCPGRSATRSTPSCNRFPLWGKRDLRRDVATADAQQARRASGPRGNELAGKIGGRLTPNTGSPPAASASRRKWATCWRGWNSWRRRAMPAAWLRSGTPSAQLEQTASRRTDHAGHRPAIAAARLNALLAREAGAILAEPQRCPSRCPVTTFDAGALAATRPCKPAVAAELARCAARRATAN